MGFFLVAMVNFLVLPLSFATFLFLFLFLSFSSLICHVVSKTKCSFYDRYMHHCSFTAEDAMLKLICQRAKIQDGHSIMVRCNFLMVLIVLLSAIKIIWCCSLVSYNHELTITFHSGR